MMECRASESPDPISFIPRPVAGQKRPRSRDGSPEDEGHAPVASGSGSGGPVVEAGDGTSQPVASSSKGKGKACPEPSPEIFDEDLEAALNAELDALGTPPPLSSQPDFISVESSHETSAPPPPAPQQQQQQQQQRDPSEPKTQGLAEYTCPICFSPPTFASALICGHIFCGECLFSAVKTSIKRGLSGPSVESAMARCPVCRAQIPGWDGKGGGVIGLKLRKLPTVPDVDQGS